MKKPGFDAQFLAFPFLYVVLVSFVVSLLFYSCGQSSGDTLFEKVSPTQTGITFSNDLTFNDSFNIYTNNNFYSGGGVGLGDINNDGLIDIYLVANQEENKLFLNKGDFEFEDITDAAGVGGERPWSTGVSIIDINGDGWLDIYVCNTGTFTNGDRRNELFINNGDLTFTERSEEYGLAGDSYSIHANFFDYDNDGDLDMYLVNYTFRSVGSFNLRNNQRNQADPRAGDRLYRNELVSSTPENPTPKGKTPRFTDVTEEAGIYSSAIGMGLGVSVGDLNRDGWMDIYVSNDFFERDYLYLNEQDGTFKEVLEQQMTSISTTSMSGDIADLNSDGYPEIFITDMLPKTEQRLKTITNYADWEQYQFELQNNYYRQFTRNTLQLNNGNGTFSEIGRFAGVEATDWSWGALIADFNMDGRRDIFVPNGIYKDMTDQDHMIRVSRPEVKRSLIKNNRLDYDKLIGMIPSNPLPNYLFENTGSMQFTDRAGEWGFGEPSFSNGSAYGDLDNDGDLDLVVNNVNMQSFVYRNRTREKHPARRWLEIDLKGTPPNTYGVGAQVLISYHGNRTFAEQVPVRGYQSTVDHRLNIAVDTLQQVDTLMVRWPDGRISRQLDIRSNQLITINQSDASENPDLERAWQRQTRVVGHSSPILEEAAGPEEINWSHVENDYVDFTNQSLLFHSYSSEGPPLCTGDLNGDGMEDFYVGGAKDQPGALFLQSNSGDFTLSAQQVFEEHKVSEDTDCTIFDADGDGINDLYVASGSGEFDQGSPNLADRLYLNNGNGKLRTARESLTALGNSFHRPTGAIAPGDYDMDGDLDLFVGFRMQPGAYGVPAGGYLLENNGKGMFSNVTDKQIPFIASEGLITDAKWGDLDGDGDIDLMVTGDWMRIELFLNDGGHFTRSTGNAGLDSTAGWWNSLELADLDQDGDLDWIGGNHGLNSRFRASVDQPVEMWINDFDRNGSTEQIITTYNNGRSYPVALRHDLLQQVPMLSSRITSFHSYAETPITEIFKQNELQDALHLQSTLLASSIGWNDGTGHFEVQPLPKEAQFSPVFGILAGDLDNDGRTDILLGGNLDQVKPQAGPYDASYGILLRQDSTGQFRSLSSQESGISIPGDIRAIKSISLGNEVLIIVARNNDSLKILR